MGTENKAAENKTHFLDKLTRVLSPIGEKCAQQKHLSAITSGMALALPLILLGAFIYIIANPPVTAAMMEEGGFLPTLFGGWYNFATAHKAAIMTPYNMTMGIYTMAAVLGISFNLAKAYKLKSTLSSAVLALAMFLLVAAPSVPAYLAAAVTGTSVEGMGTTSVIPTSNLGASGLFVGILVAIISVEIVHICESKKLTIKMPESVPPMIFESFSVLIPALLNLIVFYGLSLIVQNTTGMNVPAALMAAITPLLKAVNTPIIIILIKTFGLLLWCVGVHGTALTGSLLAPLLVMDLTTNAALIASGQAAVMSPAYLMMWGSIGGAGGTFALVLMMMRSKSKQLKMIGKVSLVPGIFGINEPVAFGVPIIFNPIMMIPYILGPLLSMFLAWGGYAIGLLAPPRMLLLGVMPIGVTELLTSMSVVNFLFAWFIVFFQGLIYYPFFKVYERQLVAKEAVESATLGQAAVEG